MEAILFIAVMVGLVLALHKAREKGGELIHRAIRPGAYKKGKEVTTRVVALNAPVSPERFLDRVIQTLDVSDKPPLTGGLYMHAREIDAEGDHIAVLAIGNPLMNNAEIALVLSPVRQGCAGSVRVVKWHETEGVVDGIDKLERVFNHVDEAVRHFGGATSVSVEEVAGNA